MEKIFESTLEARSWHRIGTWREPVTAGLTYSQKEFTQMQFLTWFIQNQIFHDKGGYKNIKSV